MSLYKTECVYVCVCCVCVFCLCMAPDKLLVHTACLSEPFSQSLPSAWSRRSAGKGHGGRGSPAQPEDRMINGEKKKIRAENFGFIYYFPQFLKYFTSRKLNYIHMERNCEPVLHLPGASLKDFQRSSIFLSFFTVLKACWCIWELHLLL